MAEVGTARSFYDKAALLDGLKTVETPTEEQISSVTDLVKDPALRRYWFHDLDNSAWLAPLARRGLFANPPPPHPAGEGMVQLPP